MRVALLTTTLEAGRCGVGDFTRRLAGDLVALGHRVLAVGLCDAHTTRRLEEGPEPGLTLLRLPAHGWSAAALGETRAALSGFDPDVTSLQVSPYGLGYHGMLYTCLPWFERLLAGRPLHVMYHELWVGGTFDEPWRQVLEGALQRRLLARFHRRLAPRAASCSSTLAQAMLEELGIAASVAPVPSGIPVAAREGAAVPPAGSGVRRLALFGNIPPEWDWRGALLPLCRAIVAGGWQAELVQLGRVGEAGQRVWAEIAAAIDLPARCSSVGATDPMSLSHWLGSCHAGLTLTPLEALGKSSAAAAYREHGLPVIGLRAPLRLRPVQGLTEWPPDAGGHRADAKLFALIEAGGWPAPAPATGPAAGLASLLGRPEIWAGRSAGPSSFTLKVESP
jgi:hypothetical protein